MRKITLKDNVNYYIDEYRQIVKRGTPKIYGCPSCGANFTFSCSCGFVIEEGEDDKTFIPANEWELDF